MNANGRGNSNYGGGHNNYDTEFHWIGSSIAAPGDRVLDNRSKERCGGVAFPPTIAAIPGTRSIAHNVHVDPCPQSDPTPCFKDARYIFPLSSRSLSNFPQNHPPIQRKLDPSAIPLDHLHIGPSSPTIGTLNESRPFASPNLKHPVPSINTLKKPRNGGNISRENNTLNCTKRQPYPEEHRHHPMMLKKPPPSSLATLKNPTSAIKKNTTLPSNISQTSHQYREQYHGNQFHPRDLKPPPPSCYGLKPRQRTKKNSYDVQYNRLGSSAPNIPTRIPSIPRAIEVDLSFGDYYNEDNHANHLSSPPLSPISCSSSMFLKHNQIDEYYPSKDIIEKQVSALPTMDSFFPKETNSVAVANPPTRETNEGLPAARNTATSNTTKCSNKDQREPEQMRNFSSDCDSRPEKPLRINSKFPSQLQLKQQRQRHQQLSRQNHELGHLPKYMYPESLNNDGTVNHPPQCDPSAIPGPRPLPSGNGISNGVATGIDATKSISYRPQLRTFTPLVHHQEYSLSLPTTDPTTLFSTKQLATEKMQSASIEIENVSRVFQNHRLTTPEDDLPLPQSPSIEVEIYPGVFEILRGAQETASAAERNFVVLRTCLVCTVEYCCIADAAFVICPTCLVVNPIDDLETYMITGQNNKAFKRSIDIKTRWGVGLGFIPDDERNG